MTEREYLACCSSCFLFIIHLFFRDEINTTNIPTSNVNASTATSSLHSADIMTMKIDPPFTLVSQVYVCELSCSRKNSFFSILHDMSEKDDV